MKSIESTRRSLAALLALAFASTAGPAFADEDVGVSTSELKTAPPSKRPVPGAELPARAPAAREQKPATKLYRLVLKNGNRYLDNGCGRQVAVRSGGTRGDACQLWRAVPQDTGWWRLQTASGGRFLDADHCGPKVGLTGLSTWENGACQAWRLTGNVGGWSKLQLRHGSQYLDAAYCGENVAMHPGSNYDGGSCQLWKLVPE